MTTETYTNHPRYLRIVELLVELDCMCPRKAAALYVLTRTSCKGLTTSQIFRACSLLLNISRIDRECRDQILVPLRELGLIEKAYKVPQSNTVKRGQHKAKSPNNMYLPTKEVLALLANKDVFTRELKAFISNTPIRRIRHLQAQSMVTSEHETLLIAAVNAHIKLMPQYRLVFMDVDDGPRAGQFAEDLMNLNLWPEDGGRWVDALLVDETHGRVWIIESVTSDGELDLLRMRDIRRWIVACGWTLHGGTTAYLTYASFSARQAKMKNLCPGTHAWIAEDGGKLLHVQSIK